MSRDEGGVPVPHDERMDAYARQIGYMADQYREWLSTHGHLQATVEFPVPDKVWVATDIVMALEQGFIKVNDAGRRMLQELGWLDDVKTMPSMMMVKMAIQHVTPPNPQDPPPPTDLPPHSRT